MFPGRNVFPLGAETFKPVVTLVRMKNTYSPSGSLGLMVHRDVPASTPLIPLPGILWGIEHHTMVIDSEHDCILESSTLSLWGFISKLVLQPSFLGGMPCGGSKVDSMVICPLLHLLCYVMGSLIRCNDMWDAIMVDQIQYKPLDSHVG